MDKTDFYINIFLYIVSSDISESSVYLWWKKSINSQSVINKPYLSSDVFSNWSCKWKLSGFNVTPGESFALR